MTQPHPQLRAAAERATRARRHQRAADLTRALHACFGALPPATFHHVPRDPHDRVWAEIDGGVFSLDGDRLLLHHAQRASVITAPGDFLRAPPSAMPAYVTQHGCVLEVSGDGARVA